MAARFYVLRKDVEERRRAGRDRLAANRDETLKEIRLYELRQARVVSQAELAGALDLAQGEPEP